MHNVLPSAIMLRDATEKALREGYFPVVVGGDHSQALGSIAGAKKFKKDARILWIDAHIDANTPESSPSKNAHGMPLSFLTGRVPGYEDWACVSIKDDLTYFGIRSYEDDEAELLADEGVLVFEPEMCDES